MTKFTAEELNLIEIMLTQESWSNVLESEGRNQSIAEIERVLDKIGKMYLEIEE